MTLAVTHSTAADGTFSASGATAWDAAHSLAGVASASQGGTGIAYFTAAGPTVARTYTFPDSDATILYSGGALGTPASGTLTNATGLPEAGLTLADNTTNNASTSAHGFLPKLDNSATNFLNGQGAWAAPAGGATLNGITAATGAVTIASGNNTGIVWNWANTTNMTVAFTFGETSAATNGTSTSGIPNQVLLKLATVAASTQSPLSVYSRGSHVFSISPSTAQALFANGDSATPTIAFAGSTGTGFSWQAGTHLVCSDAGTTAFTTWSGGGRGQFLVGNTTLSFANPHIADQQGIDTGMTLAPSIVGFAVGGLENSRFVGASGTQAFQMSNAGAVTTAYALNFRKSRGTVASPTVITTGDDLATISGFGYVGATNTYQEACRITFDSTGTISDSATGIGGIISFLHATVGAEPVVVAQLKSQHLVHSGTAPTITAGGGTNPSIVGTDESFCVTIGTGGIATSVEVTFGNAFTTNPPSVSVESDTDIIAVKITPLTTKVTITATAAFTAGSKLYCMTRGWE